MSHRRFSTVFSTLVHAYDEYKHITGGNPTIWARFHERLFRPYAHPCDHDGHMAMPSTGLDGSNWFGVNIPGGCWVPAFARFQELSLSPWARPLGPDGQVTITLHVLRPRRFQCAWFGAKPPCGCWISASARFQGPSWCPWVCTCWHDGHMTMTVHIYKPRQCQWTEFGVNRTSGCCVPASARYQGRCYTRGHAYSASMCKWPWCFISTGQDDFNELHLEWIRSVVADLL